MTVQELSVRPPAIQNQNGSFNTDYFARFIDYVDRRETTVKGYASCIRRFIRWLADNGITQPVRDDVKAYREYLKNSDLSTGTQAQYLRAVKQFFKWTASENLYPNVADNLHGPTIRHDIYKRDALDKTDVPYIAETIDRTTETGKRDFAMFLLGVICGLRCIEISRATVGDIHTVGGKTFLYVQGKGHDEPDAPDALIPPIKAAIDDYLQSRSDDYNAKSPLFVSTSNRSKGKRIAASTISTLIKRILVSAGYDSSRLTAHSLRHTAGTGAYLATGDPVNVQNHLNHSNISTSMNYTHFNKLKKEQTTTQQVYNYYFDSDNTADDRRAALELIDKLDQAELKQVIKYINTKIRKGAGDNVS